MAPVKQYLVLMLALLSVPAVFADITIGMSAGFSGPLGQDNLAYRYGVQAAFAKLNAQGGVRGEPLKLEALDDEFSEALAERNAQRFTNRKNVLAILGGGEHSSLALARVAEREDILFLGGVAMPPQALDKTKNVLSVRPTMSTEAGFLCDSFKAQGIQRVSVVHPETSVMFGFVQQACQAKKVEVESVSYPVNSLGFHDTVKRASAITNSDVLLLGDSRTLNILLRQLGMSFYENKTLWLTSAVDPKSVKGQLLSIRSLKSVSFLGASVLTTPTYQDYTKSLADLNPYLTPHMRGFEGYITALVLARGLEDVVNPFNLETPSDALKLPLNVVRRFTGWVQEGKDPERQRQLIIALSVMGNLNLGSGAYPGFHAQSRVVDWDFFIVEN